MGKSTTTGQSELTERSEPKSSADSGPDPKPPWTKESGKQDSVNSLKKTALTKKSTGSLPPSKNLPPSALLSKASTNISANGGAGEINPNAIVKTIELRLLKAIADGPQVQAAFAAKMAE